MLRYLWTDLFRIWYDAKQYLTQQFDSNLDDLDVYSKSHGYRKARTCSYCVVKWHEASQNVGDGWLYKRDDCEEAL